MSEKAPFFAILAGMKPRVLLLNLPGRKNYARDNFLGGELEPGLRLPPQDLVALSGTLSPHAELSVVDALAEGLSVPATLARVKRLDPRHIVFVVSGASYEEDSVFLPRLRAQHPRARFIGLGDVYREVKGLAFPLHPFLDAILLDSTTDDVLAAIRPGAGPRDNVLLRDGDAAKGVERHHYGEWSLPAPRWDLFPLALYRWPFSRGKCATLATDFGCPYSCTYCPASTLAHKTRGVESVVAEAKVLWGLGVRSVYFRDQTFGAHRGRTTRLLSRLLEEGLRFSWVCTTRVDLAEEGLLQEMKAAGCVGVSFGMDSGEDDLLRAYKKNTTRAQAALAVAAARRCGLKAWGTFVLGLSMDTPPTVERTLAFAKGLGLDHCSITVEAHRFSAGYRRQMLSSGLVPPEAMPPDTPNRISVWQGRLGISNSDVFAEHARAAGGRG